MIIFAVIIILLLAAELLYFRIADKFNIIDKPNMRSSHTQITLRGGGIIFLIGTWLYTAFYGMSYPWFLTGLTLIALISFIDDIHSIPNKYRLVVQFVSMFLMFIDFGIVNPESWWIIIVALIVCVGVINAYNFMDGINGITGGYSLAVLIPLLLLNRQMHFIDNSFIIVSILSVIVFNYFNFRPKGKAKCFAGDVGSISIAFIVLFILGHLILQTQDLTYLLFLVVYGIDSCLTIVHRIMLHENLGEAHRKHAFQLMANELKIGHTKVTTLYMAIQLAVSLAFIYAIPDTTSAHWIYMSATIILLSLAYLLFMKKYYHLHEDYLKTINDK